MDCYHDDNSYHVMEDLGAAHTDKSSSLFSPWGPIDADAAHLVAYLALSKLFARNVLLLFYLVGVSATCPAWKYDDRLSQP